MSCCDDCECQGIPRVTLWSENTPGVDVGDYYLPTRRRHPITFEDWGADQLRFSFAACRFSTVADNLLIEWVALAGNQTRLIVSTVDDAEHVLTRHEFQPISPISSYFDMSIEQGDDPDEFVITFAGWCTVLPLTISIANNRDDDDQPDVPETITQTSAHVWTFTRATDVSHNVSTLFSIGGVVITILETDTLEQLQTRFSETEATEHFIGTNCEHLRRELFYYVASYGTNDDFDAPPVIVQLDMTEKRPAPIAMRTHVPTRPFLMIEADPESGLHFGSLHSIQAAHAGESAPDENVWTFAAYPLSDAAYPGGTGVFNQVFVRKCNNRWSLVTRRGSAVNFLYDLWLPVTDDLPGDRPGTIVFEWSRPFSPSGPADDGSRPSKDEPDTFPTWDLAGKRFNVYVMANPEAISIFGFTVLDRGLAVESEGWVGTNANLLNCELDKLADSSFVSLEDPDTDLASFVLGVHNRHENYPIPDDSVSFVLVGWTGGYTQTEISPHEWSYYNRRVELVVSTGESRVVFVPSSGPLPVIDEFFDAAITWVYDRSEPDVTSSAENATITTRLSMTVPGDCPNYEDFGHEAPFVFSLKYENDTYLLPRTGPSKWSRILNIGGESLAFCLEHHRSGVINSDRDAGWRLTIYTADTNALPWRKVYQFLPGNTSDEPEIGEWPPFGHWKPYAENELSMIWHREHDDSLPATVSVTGWVPPTHPAGTSDWSWGELARDWLPLADNSHEDYRARKPPTRASSDGATRTTISGVQVGEEGVGDIPSNWVAWWSPDGVDWVVLVDGTPNILQTRPPAPTDPPTGPGDVYRAFCIPTP